MAPKKEKADQIKGEAAETLVLEYLRKANRPYNAADIAANLKTVSKPVTAKVLQILADRGDLCAKSYGKQIIYAVRQDDVQVADPTEIEAWKLECEELKKQVTASQQELKKEKAALQDLKSQPDISDLPLILAELEEKIGAHKARLEALRKSCNPESSSTATTPDALELQKLHLERAIPAMFVRKMKFFELLEVLKPDLNQNELAKFSAEDIGVEYDLEEEGLFDKKCRNMLEHLKKGNGKKRKRDE